MHNVKPVSNYTLHENKWLQIKGLIKENFSTPIEVIYFDDFLDFSSDENCEAQVKFLNYFF